MELKSGRYEHMFLCDNKADPEAPSVSAGVKPVGLSSVRFHQPSTMF